jgi:hypothetical protein
MSLARFASFPVHPSRELCAKDIAIGNASCNTDSLTLVQCTVRQEDNPMTLTSQTTSLTISRCAYLTADHDSGSDSETTDNSAPGSAVDRAPPAAPIFGAIRILYPEALRTVCWAHRDGGQHESEFLRKDMVRHFINLETLVLRHTSVSDEDVMPLIRLRTITQVGSRGISGTCFACMPRLHTFVGGVGGTWSACEGYCLAKT